VKRPPQKKVEAKDKVKAEVKVKGKGKGKKYNLKPIPQP
jgi:hypothetical protein